MVQLRYLCVKLSKPGAISLREDTDWNGLSMATDRNSAKEIQRDIEFLEELNGNLRAGQNGDVTRLQSLGEKLDHWIDELSTK